jgi:aminoglycoside phosphotransferase (APT) family kinase protein
LKLPFGPTASPGMMTREAIARRYLERSGRRTDSLVFYYAFGLLKTAVIAQQIYYRFAKGLTKDARFAQMILGVRLLSEQARMSIEPRDQSRAAIAADDSISTRVSAA